SATTVWGSPRPTCPGSSSVSIELAAPATGAREEQVSAWRSPSTSPRRWPVPSRSRAPRGRGPPSGSPSRPPEVRRHTTVTPPTPTRHLFDTFSAPIRHTPGSISWRKTVDEYVEGSAADSGGASDGDGCPGDWTDLRAGHPGGRLYPAGRHAGDQGRVDD